MHILRSSHQEVFCEKGVLKNFTKQERKHLYWSFFLNIVAYLCNFIKKEIPTLFFIGHIRWLLLTSCSQPNNRALTHTFPEKRIPIRFKLKCRCCFFSTHCLFFPLQWHLIFLSHSYSKWTTSVQITKS